MKSDHRKGKKRSQRRDHYWRNPCVINSVTNY